MQETLNACAENISTLLRTHAWQMVTAESCTGGMIATALTDLAGSSEIFERGFVTYSNASKHQLLGVSPSLIDAYGAVSSEVAHAMAEGALQHSNAQLSVAVTGIAGPGGGTKNKPVGTVFIAAATRAPHCRTERHLFSGDRAAIREQSAIATLKLAGKLLARKST